MLYPSNILIIRLSSIGDIILTTPLVRAVRMKYPKARISFLVKKENVDLLKCNPYINQLIIFDKAEGFRGFLKLRKKIRKEHFDWVIDLHNNLRVNLLKASLWFPQVSTYSKQSIRRHLLVIFGTNFFREAKPVYLKYFEAVQKHEIEYDGKGTDVMTSDAESGNIREMLISDGWYSGQPVVVICPAASYTNKRWLPKGFADLADSLIVEMDARIIFLGGPKDLDYCEDILLMMKHQTYNYAGLLSLSESASMLGLANLVVSNDSGMMHLAQSQKRPVVAIFGPTTRELGFFPLPELSEVIEKDVYCRPCTTKGLNRCPRENFDCMNRIETRQVLKACRKMIIRPFRH